MRMWIPALAALGLTPGCRAPLSPPSLPAGLSLRQQVADTERAFAKTMATRDHRAFARFLSPEAVFFSGAQPLHGSAEVAAWGQRYFQTPEAPFSWAPEQVEVLASGTLALSTGPVHNATGKLIGTYTSIWRRDASGEWRILFDRGNPVCDKP